MPTKPEQNFRRASFAVAAGFNVDREAGVLRNLSLLEAGREAKGHGLYIDAETIKTAHECALARKQLKGALRHLSWDEYFSKGGDRVLDFPGWFAGFSVKGEGDSATLAAEKFEFYETFRQDQPAAFSRIIEMAEKTPNVFGLSIEAWGYAVFVAEDGKEYGTKPDGVSLKYDGTPALRVTDLFFAAFVDEPAATSGLFAKFATKFPALSALFGDKQNAEKNELIVQLREFADELAKMSPSQTAVPSGAPSENELSTMKLIADLKAKFTEPTRLAAAMSVLANTPQEKLATLSVADVEAQLVTVDLAAVRAEVARLTTELSTAQTQVTNLTAERDSWKNKYETFKKSGRDPIDLGAGGNGGSKASEVNPFLKASWNETEQAKLFATDPARAKQLQADAAGK